jgi:hypothetical protein
VQEACSGEGALIARCREEVVSFAESVDGVTQVHNVGRENVIEESCDKTTSD